VFFVIPVAAQRQHGLNFTRIELPAASPGLDNVTRSGRSRPENLLAGQRTGPRMRGRFANCVNDPEVPTASMLIERKIS
jgi:hypothetical protein